jgi:integrase
MRNIIIRYVVSLKLSKQYKQLVFYSLKHACEMNDIVLNWKKMSKFVKAIPDNRNRENMNGNANGYDRGYTHGEILKIINHCDQRIRMVFLLLASTGVRSGVLSSLRIRNLKKVANGSYKITVYEGDREESFTFCTPECGREIDAYLEFRRKHSEDITTDSFLIVKRFDTNLNIEIRGKPFAPQSLQVILDDYIVNSGVKVRDHGYANRFKRKPVPMFHGFRKFFTTQLVNSKVNPEIREMLLGHKIGLAGCYYRPTEEEMYAEYEKAIDLLTINEENRLKKRIREYEGRDDAFSLELTEKIMKRLEEKGITLKTEFN